MKNKAMELFRATVEEYKDKDRKYTVETTFSDNKDNLKLKATGFVLAKSEEDAYIKVVEYAKKHDVKIHHVKLVKIEVI